MFLGSSSNDPALPAAAEASPLPPKFSRSLLDTSIMPPLPAIAPPRADALPS